MRGDSRAAACTGTTVGGQLVKHAVRDGGWYELLVNEVLLIIRRISRRPLGYIMTGTNSIPKSQLAATVPQQGTPIKVVFEDNYPVPVPGKDEVLVKVLYTGVCQSGKSREVAPLQVSLPG